VAAALESIYKLSPAVLDEEEETTKEKKRRRQGRVVRDLRCSPRVFPHQL
jgi:hypothetical protein